MSKPATPEERAQHAVRLKMADDKWAELVAAGEYENADSTGPAQAQWYWTTGFIHGMRAAEPEIYMMREAIRRLADQDATLSVCNGNVTIDCSTEIKLELTDEQRAVLAAAIERDKKRAVMLVPGPLKFTDEERKAVSRAYDMLYERAGQLQASGNIDASTPFVQSAKALQRLWERLGGGE